jgi:transposase
LFDVVWLSNRLYHFLPKKWVVERIFSWIRDFRRLAKDFETLAERAENLIRIAMMKITLGAVVKV